ncbi:MAG: ComF family protein [Oscillospiraceae bacterium]|nr:ComF family protein [Oscillospiraceae bacterium]
MSFLNTLFPPKCIFCGELLPPDESYIEPCVKCLSALPLQREPLDGIIPGTVCLAPLKYTDNVRRGLHGLKFGRRLVGVRYFARLMAQCLKRHRFDGFDAVTWVPVSRTRRQHRGFDQAEQLAREVAKLIDVKPRKLLNKTRHTQPNSRLKSKDERQKNVSGVYRPALFAKKYNKVLLIDDIITTGSTITECVSMLKRHGTGEIIVLAAASAVRGKIF